MPTGFLLINPDLLAAEQVNEFYTRSDRQGGWPHPDGIRWILPVEYPTHAKKQLILEGWPATAIEIAR